jgi:hypothetical protein
MSVNPSQSWITPTTALFGTGSISSFSTISSFTTASISSLTVSTINGSAYLPASPINFLVRPEATRVITLNSGDNDLASTFVGDSNLDANSIYRLTFKGVLSWSGGIPDSNDWVQVYVQLGSGGTPDDTRIYPVMPLLASQYGGNTIEYMNLETLFRTTVSTTFDLIESLNTGGSATYQQRINWISLQKMGSYT